MKGEDQNDPSVLLACDEYTTSGNDRREKNIIRNTVMMTILKVSLPLRSQAPRNI